MTIFKNYYELMGPNYTPQEIETLKNRWNLELKTLKARIVAALEDDKLLSSTLAGLYNVVYTYNHQEMKLLDMRGIDFSNLKLGEMDFSYCCFDFSNFENCCFEHTHFQYSSFQQANLKNTTWLDVQASPCSLVQSDLTNAIVKDSFLMHCDFSQASTSNLTLPGSALDASHMNAAQSRF